MDCDGAALRDGEDDIPPAVLAVINERLVEVSARVVAAGLEVRDGVIADETEAMDGDLETSWLSGPGRWWLRPRPFWWPSGSGECLEVPR